MLSELAVLSSGFSFDNSNYNYTNTNTNSSSHLCGFFFDIDLADSAKKDLLKESTGNLMVNVISDRQSYEKDK